MNVMQYTRHRYPGKQITAQWISILYALLLSGSYSTSRLPLSLQSPFQPQNSDQSLLQPRVRFRLSVFFILQSGHQTDPSKEREGFGAGIQGGRSSYKVSPCIYKNVTGGPRAPQSSDLRALPSGDPESGGPSATSPINCASCDGNCHFVCLCLIHFPCFSQSGSDRYCSSQGGYQLSERLFLWPQKTYFASYRNFVLQAVATESVQM